MHALHNHSHILLAIPPALSKPPDLGLDRISLRNEAATTLRDQALQKKFARETRSRKAAEDARHAQTARLDDLEAILEDTSALAVAADAPSEYHNEVVSTPLPSSLPAEVFASSMGDNQPQPRGPRKRNPAKAKPRATATRASEHPEPSAALIATTIMTTSPQSTTRQPSPPRKRRRASTKTLGDHAT